MNLIVKFLGGAHLQNQMASSDTESLEALSTATHKNEKEVSFI